MSIAERYRPHNSAQKCVITLSSGHPHTKQGEIVGNQAYFTYIISGMVTHTHFSIVVADIFEITIGVANAAQVHQIDCKIFYKGPLMTKLDLVKSIIQSFYSNDSSEDTGKCCGHACMCNR